MLNIALNITFNYVDSIYKTHKTVETSKFARRRVFFKIEAKK